MRVVSVSSGKFEIKIAREMVLDPRRYRVPCCVDAELFHAGHGLRDPARNNILEILQIRIQVEGEAVGGDPAADVHADRREFRAAHPNAGASGNALAGNAEIRQRIDQDLFERAHVEVHIALPFA